MKNKELKELQGAYNIAMGEINKYLNLKRSFKEIEDELRKEFFGDAKIYSQNIKN